MASVSFHDVRKRYGTVEAVKGVTFDVPDGAFCVLVGPSGCGKSTLLRMVAGVEVISSGEIRIGGKVVNQIEPADRDIAMVFQNYALYPHMRVYDNMAYGLRNRGTPKPEIDQRVREAARILELGELLDRKPRELSGGQRQRVAMGRAIVRKPKAFLFDEPLSNLDAKLRVSMRVEIRRLQQSLGTTSIYVTHDQLEAMTLADKLVVMNKGLVEQIGAPLDIYSKPATTFVASFIGAPPMNLVNVRAAGEGMALREGEGLSGGAGLGVSGDAVLGVRPEDLSLTEAAPAGGVSFQLNVIATERVGPESFVYGACGLQTLIVRVPGHEVPAPGAQVTATAPREKLHLFASDSGRRIDG